MFPKVFIVILAVGVSFSPLKAMALSAQEGFLYSAIGCTSVFKKTERQDKADIMLNLIHNFSNKNQITEIQPGYLTRFIKLVERKWEKDHEVAKKNCDGIFGLAEKEPKPDSYNAVAESVIEYMWDLERNKRPDFKAQAPDE